MEQEYAQQLNLAVEQIQLQSGEHRQEAIDAVNAIAYSGDPSALPFQLKVLEGAVPLQLPYMNMCHVLDFLAYCAEWIPWISSGH